MNSRTLGFIEVILAGMLFGLLGFFGKKATEYNIQAEELLGLRFLLGSFFIYCLLKIRDPSTTIKLPLKKVLFCLLMGVGGYALFSTFYFAAINGISASVAVLLLYTFPVWVLIGGWLFLGENIERQKLYIFPLIAFGLYLLSYSEIVIQSWWSFFLGAASGFLYAIYILLSRKYLQKEKILVYVIYIQFFAGLCLSFYSFVSINGLERIATVWQTFWPYIVAMAILCGAGAMGLFQSGLQKIRGWEASLLSTSEPITGILIAYFFLGESMVWQQALGAVLILASLVYLAIPKAIK